MSLSLLVQQGAYLNKIIIVFILLRTLLITSILGSITFHEQLDRIVLESDGCEISNDLALRAFNQELLMLLAAGEEWNPDVPRCSEYDSLGYGMYQLSEYFLNGK